MNYYERHIGDYLKDTAHLSLLEHGVYTRLMDVYYTREGAIPVADVARLVGARSKDERAALAVVLDEFFEAVDGMLKQGRCEAEIARFQDKQRKAKASADARWSKGPQHTEGNANAMRTHSEGNADGMHRAPVPSNQSPVTTLVPKVQRGRGARLPPSWDPGETGMAFASSQGLANGRAASELEKFRDHWAAKTGQDAAKADWQAAWRNWVRRAIEFKPADSACDDPFAGAH